MAEPFVAHRWRVVSRDTSVVIELLDRDGNVGASIEPANVPRLIKQLQDADARATAVGKFLDEHDTGA